MRSRWTHDLPARVVLIPTLLLGVAFSPGRAQDWLPGESLRMAIFNLEVTLEVQRNALESELDRLNGEMVRREGIYAALARRFEEIRALATAAGGATSGAALDQMEDEVRALVAEAASSSQRIRALRDSVRESSAWPSWRPNFPGHRNRSRASGTSPWLPGAAGRSSPSGNRERFWPGSICRMAATMAACRGRWSAVRCL